MRGSQLRIPRSTDQGAPCWEIQVNSSDFVEGSVDPASGVTARERLNREPGMATFEVRLAVCPRKATLWQGMQGNQDDQLRSQVEVFPPETRTENTNCGPTEEPSGSRLCDVRSRQTRGQGRTRKKQERCASPKSEPGRRAVRMLTWNVGGLPPERVGEVLGLLPALGLEQVEVVALQDVSCHVGKVVRSGTVLWGKTIRTGEAGNP